MQHLGVLWLPVPASQSFGPGLCLTRKREIAVPGKVGDRRWWQASRESREIRELCFTHAKE